MSQSMIDQLRGLSPEDRPCLLRETYEKNMEFFRRRHPSLLSVVQQENCPYQLNITNDFLSITHEGSGQLAHPEAGLDKFAAMMGDWVHDTWIDLCNFKVPAMDLYPEHGGPLRKLYQQLLTEFPKSLIRFSLKQVNLKELPDGRRFSPPVIFLGIFHGLHIDFYLSRTEVSHVLMVEPDRQRFEVSCYFLDYRRICERSEVVFSLGPDPQSEVIKYYFSNYSVSRHLWTRVLPVYEHPQNPHLIESFRMHQATMSNVTFPLDWEYNAVRQIMANLRQQRPLLTSRPRLSKKSRIAVVAAGPSLDHDIEWLRANQDNLIIFAVFSAVRPLLRHGVRPDFQVTLETMLHEESLGDLLGLDPEIPVIAGCNAPPSIVRYFNEILLCGIGDKVAPVRFTLPIHRVLPSSATMAFSFACLCQPREIYMLGCDFGYHSVDKSHAGGTIYDESEQGLDEQKVDDYLDKMQQILVEANFASKDRKLVTSTPFLTHVRIIVEQLIEAAGNKTTVYNLSDGARVRGARARRSQAISLRKYPRKQDDVERIRKAFLPAQKGRNWKSYIKDSKQVAEGLKRDVIHGLELETFTWKKCNQVVDRAVLDAVMANREDDRDRRPEVFVLFILHLLTAWYKVLLFADRQEMAEKIYRSGLEKIRAVVEKLEWPVEELD